MCCTILLGSSTGMKHHYFPWEPTEEEMILLRCNPKRRRVSEASHIGFYYLIICQEQNEYKMHAVISRIFYHYVIIIVSQWPTGIILDKHFKNPVFKGFNHLTFPI